MPDIMHLVKINASPERVYHALTTAEGIDVVGMLEAAMCEEDSGTARVRSQIERDRRVHPFRAEGETKLAFTANCAIGVGVTRPPVADTCVPPYERLEAN
jgi:hypothetical protein